MSTPTKKFNLLFKNMKQMKMLKDNEANENFKTYEANKMLKDNFKTNEIILRNSKQEFVKIHKQH